MPTNSPTLSTSLSLDKSQTATYHKGYRFWVEPTYAQVKILKLYARADRFITNEALRLWKLNGDSYRRHRKDNGASKKYYFNKHEFSRELTEVLRLPDVGSSDYGWLKNVTRSILTCALDDLDKAFQAMASGHGFPKFKSYKDGERFSLALDFRHDSKKLAWSGVLKNSGGEKPIKRRIILNEDLGPLKVKFTDTDVKFPSKVTISQNKTGRWLISFQNEIPREHVAMTPEMVEAILLENLKKAGFRENVNKVDGAEEHQNFNLRLHKSFKQELIRNPNLAGFDLGIKDLLVGSDGSVFKNPKKFHAYQRQLRTQNQNLSRKVKGSNNWKKNRVKLAKVHQKIQAARQDCAQKMTSKIVNKSSFKVICIEALKVKNMLKNRKLSKSLADANFGEIVRQLMYKANWQGKLVLQVDTFFPSSKTCFDCGLVYQDLKLSQRSWVCEGCGARHNRDQNAANNILFEAIKNYAFEQGFSTEILEVLIPDAAQREEAIQRAASRTGRKLSKKKVVFSTGRKKVSSGEVATQLNEQSAGLSKIDQIFEEIQDVSGNDTGSAKLVEKAGCKPLSVKQAPDRELISSRSSALTR